MENKIIFYTIGCVQCDVLQIKLDQKNISYSICDDKNAMSEKGITTLPMLEVDGELLSFSQAVKWVNKQRGTAYGN